MYNKTYKNPHYFNSRSKCNQEFSNSFGLDKFFFIDISLPNIIPRNPCQNVKEITLNLQNLSSNWLKTFNFIIS